MRKLFQNWTRKAWLAISLQERRRARQSVAATPNAPVITAGTCEWDITTAGWADVSIAWTFAHGSFPVALLELWLSVNGGAFASWDTFTSTVTNYTYAEATHSGASFRFQLRYRNGATLGPFSNVYQVDAYPE